MQAALRPMSTAQVLDRTFHIYRNRFPLLAGIGILLPVLLLVVRLAFVPLGYPPRGPALRDSFLFWTIFLEYWASWMLLYVIGHAITAAATVYAVSRLHLGEHVTIAEAYRKALPRFWTLLRIALNIYLRVVGSLLVTVGAVLLGAFGLDFLFRFLSISSNNVQIWGGAISVGLVFLAGVLWMLYLYAKYCLAIPASIIEGLPARPALRRSRFLARQSLRRITLIYLLMMVLGLGLSTVLWLPGQFYSIYFRHSLIMAILLRSLGSFIAGALAGPIATIAIALVYYDQRVRKEAFDLQFMMESMPQRVAEPAPSATLGAESGPSVF
jgi:hypothetical protein